ncbi:hypothetical protein M3Y94_00978100 [Aphelenchoides besseyi]|nr:hypothetical protein M3Y94_00978100 [Aphelenchoides besseyi]KAI6221041.1 Hexosyltransferase [Aphelenchoides besseyi]
MELHLCVFVDYPLPHRYLTMNGQQTSHATDPPEHVNKLPLITSKMQIRERPSISPSTSFHALDFEPTAFDTKNDRHLRTEPWNRRLKDKFLHLQWQSLLPSSRSLLLISIFLSFSILALYPLYHYFSITPFLDPDDVTFQPPPHFDFAGETNSKTKMLIVVISEVDDSTQRQLIREDWGHKSKRKDSTELVFLVGLSRHNNTELKMEQLLFNDLVLTSIVENYYNLSLKTLAMFLFAQSHYPSAKCVVKVDSDNVLNVTNLEDLCDSFNEDENIIVGHCEDNTTVIREWTSKWRIPRFVYVPDFYPLYCFGETYVFVGRKTPKKLLDQLDDYRFYHSANARTMPEDLIFSGLLAIKAGIERRNIDGFALQRHNSKFGCLYGRPRAYSFHLIGDHSNFSRAHFAMNQTNDINCEHF